MRYEYKIQPTSLGDPNGENPQVLHEDEQILNNLGKDGWELVAVVEPSIQYLALGRSLLYFLKRAVP